MKKGKTGDKLMKIGKAAAGGVAGNFAISMLQKIPTVASLDIKIQKAIPLIGSFFAFGLDESFALGMAGAAGGNVAHEFGIGDIADMTEDDLSGLEHLDEMNGYNTDIGGGEAVLQGLE